MHIAFSPALGETIHVAVPTRTRPSAVQLHFTATLSSAADYEQFSAGRAKLQVCDFDVHFTEPDSHHTLSLLPGDGPLNGGSKRLSLEFSVPLSGQSRFSFTYRLVYPSGETKWLGQYGHNGTLVLDRKDAEPVSLGEGWVSSDDAYIWDSGGRVVQSLEVAKLIHPADYMAFAVAKNNFLGDPKDSSLLVFVPRISSHPIMFPPTLVFGATPAATISFTSRGAITISGTGSLLFMASSGPEAITSGVINHCSSPYFRVVNNSPRHVILASVADKYPVEVAVIPLAPSNVPCQSRVPLRALAFLLPETPQFSVFSLPGYDARFFSRKLSEESDESLLLTVAPSGGRFLLAPTVGINAGDVEWQVGIMCPYTPAPLPAPADGLPTPPPSPRLHPLTHRASGTPFQSPDPSFLSLPAAGAPDADADVPAPSSASQVAARARRAGVLSYIWYIVLLFSTWLHRVFRYPRLEALPRRIAADERTPLLQPQQTTEVVVSVEEPRYVAAASTPSSAFHADVGGGKVTLLFQSVQPSPMFNVPIQFNGQNADLNVQQVSDTLFVVELDGGAGGMLKIGV
ncbi:hypothetical protein B0H10DRAFT_1996298 [Mycena sp. CBHHK59/15]|nr:hypothetical protein B0H10DRAFT_1996298 [Mycena sp. CBHHK59/15]